MANNPTNAQMLQELQALRAQVQAMQQGQTGLSVQQVQQLLAGAMTQVQTNPVVTPMFNPGVNAVLTARARAIHANAADILNEDHPPAPGAPNIKATKPPPAFSGQKEDARPFLDRVDAWFALVPVTYRLTKSRLLATCSLITSKPADAWATAVLNAVAKDEDTPYYYDNWVTFKKDFLVHFGIANEEEDARTKLMRIIQGSMELSVFTAEFLRLQQRAGMSDDAALHEYKRAIFRPIYYQVCNLVPQPNTLAAWITAARERHQVAVEARRFDQINRGGPQPVARPPGQAPPRAPFFPRPPIPPYRAPHHPTRDPNAMDVDSINVRGPTTPKVSFRTPLTTPANARSTTGPSILKRQVPAPSNATRDRVPGCYRCGKPGHFMRDCTTNVNAIDEQHVQVLEDRFSAFLECMEANDAQPTEHTGEEEEHHEFEASIPGNEPYDEEDF
jgi:hypothetical protein